jgi:hypothetical protein
MASANTDCAQQLYACGNCAFETPDPDILVPAKDLYQRVSPGESLPAGECPECGCLVHALSTESRASAELIERARARYAMPSDDDIEVDDDARISEGEGGTWVQAWVWVPDAADSSAIRT